MASDGRRRARYHGALRTFTVTREYGEALTGGVTGRHWAPETGARSGE